MSYPSFMDPSAQTVGARLREWRQRRHLSQLALACDVQMSTRHLSFVETGRSSPSREMILRLAARLDVPVRERNVLLIAAGFAPMFPERTLDDPALDAARAAIDLVLQAQRPYPAFALDRRWNIAASNHALPALYVDVDPSLRTPPVNVLRLTLHPRGLAPRILNLAEWRAHMLSRLRHQIDLTADVELITLLEEVAAYPACDIQRESVPHAVAIPLQLDSPAGALSFLSTTTLFGSPFDVTVAEIAIESFFPADAVTPGRVRVVELEAVGAG